MLEAVQRLALLLSILCILLPPLCFGVTKSSSHQRGSNKGILLGHSSSASHVCSLLKSELCIFYLDDGTLGGVLSDVLHGIEVIKKEAGIVNLDLNPQTSEVISINPDLIATVQSALSGIRVVNQADATLLGSPIGDIGSITVAIDAKTAMLKCLRERLPYRTCHDACVTLWPYLNFCTCLERHLAFSHPV